MERDAPQDEAARLWRVLDALVRANDAVAEPDSHNALEDLFDATEAAVGAQRCLLLLGSAGYGRRLVRASRRLSPEFLQHLESGYLAMWRRLNGRALLAEPDVADSDLPEASAALLRAEGIAAYAAIELRLGAEAVGILAVYYDEPHTLSAAERRLLELLGRQASALLRREDVEPLLASANRQRDASAQHLQDVLDRLRDAIVVWDPHIEVLSANASARLLAASAERPDAARIDALLLAPAQCPVHQAFRDGRAVQGVVAEIHGRHYEIDALPIRAPESDEVVAVVQQARDVTTTLALQRDLAGSEQRWRTAMDLAPVGMLLLAVPGGAVREANQAVAQLCGVPAEQLRGRSFVSLFAAPEAPRAEALLEQALVNGQEAQDDLELATASERPAALASVTLRRLELPGGEPQVQCVFKDLTRRQRLQAQMIEQEKLAAIGQLAAGVAHEIRNPLAIIAGALFDLEEILEVDDIEVIEDLTIAREEILRVHEVIGHVLEFARQPSSECDWVDFGEVVRRTVELTRQGLHARQIAVELTVEDTPLLWGRRDALRQIALNLLTNSYQATSDGGEIRVSVERDGANWVRFTVADTGEGIAPENLSRIFNPFFSTKGPDQGTGMGLSIVYAAVREHGGDIEVDSRPGRGSVFRVRLPVLAPADVDASLSGEGA